MMLPQKVFIFIVCFGKIGDKGDKIIQTLVFAAGGCADNVVLADVLLVPAAEAEPQL